MVLTKEKVESLAPDQASLAAALKLMKPAQWPVLAHSADQSLLWGECQGSGATPYRVVVSPGDVGYKCTCPSRKFPCKHALAVMWMCIGQPARFSEAATPAWVDEWMARRRQGTGRPSQKPAELSGGDAGPKAAPSLDAALADGEAEPKAEDPKAAARAEAQRKRLKAEREAAVLSGLDDLERWLEDQLNAGLAGFAQRAVTSAKTLTKRLVDAKAQGLAGRLEQLAADVFRVPETLRADLAFERLGALALLASAYRHQDRLPAPLAADVRRATGWTQKREELLADQSAPRVATRWIIAAALSEVQPDKLRRLETWLMDAAPQPDRPRAAVLIDFVPVSAGISASPFAAGETLDGEVVFYPSAAPLRGLLATRAAAPGDAPWPAIPEGLSPALDEYASRLAVLPWLESWPLAASSLSVRSVGRGLLALADAHGTALTIERGQSEALTPMLGLDGISALVLWDGHFAKVLAADTPLGRWYEG